jgi:hypothetical protein
MKKISEHNIKLGINFKAFSNPNEAMIWLDNKHYWIEILHSL